MADRKSKLIQGLEEYLANTSEEQLKKDWEELEKYNHYGPEIEDCLDMGRQHCLELQHYINTYIDDNNLLLIDISTRLSYGVKFACGNNTYDAKGIDLLVTEEGEWRFHITSFDTNPIELKYIKPYLRPLSSMTEQEKKEYQSLCEVHIDHDADDNVTYYFFDTIESIDWLNKNMFDYRELIPKGLAIAVTKENNPYDSKNNKLKNLNG